MALTKCGIGESRKRRSMFSIFFIAVVLNLVFVFRW